MNLKQRIVGELRERLGREPTEAEIDARREAFTREQLAEMAASGAARRARNPKPSPPLRPPAGSRDLTAEYAGKTIAIVGSPFPAPKDR